MAPRRPLPGPFLPDPHRSFMLDLVQAKLSSEARQRPTPGPLGTHSGTRTRPTLSSGGLAGRVRSPRAGNRRTKAWAPRSGRELLDGLLEAEWSGGSRGVGKAPTSPSGREAFLSKKSTFDELRDELRDTEPARPGVAGSTVRTLSRGLQPPGRWKSETACRDDIEGSTDVCTVQSTSRSWTTVLRGLDLDSAADSLKIKNATTEETALIVHAWAVLQANVDLIRWSVCWVTGRTEGYLGRDDAWNCLIKRVEGEKRTKITMKDSNDGVFSAGPSGIKIYQGSSAWQNYTFGWTKGSRDQCGLGRIDAACQVLDLACTLLHEATHVCGHAWGDSSGECDKSYLVENIFRWALMRRYYTVGGSSCCDRFVSRDPATGRRRESEEMLFGDDTAHYAHSCVKKARPTCQSAPTFSWIS